MARSLNPARTRRPPQVLQPSGLTIRKRCLGEVFSSCPCEHFHHLSTSLRGNTSKGVVSPFNSGCQLAATRGLTSARDFSRRGINVIGVPKTIDNDLGSTDFTFGFNTAIGIVTDCLDRLHTTAESHHRILIAEVMGRNAGWIALHAGIAGDAHIILIPEIPYSIDKIVDKINERKAKGYKYTLIVVSEGAKSITGETVVAKVVEDSPDPIRFGGIANKIAHDLEGRVSDQEIRSTILGHIQRGGNTSTYDRVLSTRYGAAAARLISEGKFGNMVCLKGDEISCVSLEDVIGKEKYVDPNHELVEISKKMGIGFGD